MLEKIYVRFRYTADFEPPAGLFLTVQMWDCCGPYRDELPALPASDRRVGHEVIRFLDVDPDTPGRAKCNYAGEENEFGHNRWIQSQQAARLWAAVREAVAGGATSLVIHCIAGLSRSASAAMAIADRLGLPRSAIDWRPREGDFNQYVNDDPPNRHVYRTVREAYPG